MTPAARLLVPALAVFLSACVSSSQFNAPKVDQTGVLKVHPALLGKPGSPETQPPRENPERASPGASQPLKRE